MGVTSSERSALERLASARLRGDAKPDELLELAETAIDQATAAGDFRTIESVAAELDLAAPAHPGSADGLRLRLAAGRARALASRLPTSSPSDAAREDVGAPVAAEVAFWTTVAITGLTLFLIGALAGRGDDSGYGIAIVLMVVVALGSLLVALSGAVGFVQSVRAGSRTGILMSAVPCVVLLSLIVLRVSLSLL
jgi:hypothetical protein